MLLCYILKHTVMGAKLVALAGPREGDSFAVEDEFTIGRESGNTLALEDNCLSRRHCALTRTGARFTIRDLGTKNGTYVNGLPVAEQLLEDRDEIRAGSSLFLFLCREKEAEVASSGAQIDDSAFSSGATVLLRREEALYADPAKISRALPPNERSLRDLATLLKIGGALPESRTLETLAQKLLELILEAIPAERGAVLLSTSGSPEPESSFCRSRAAGEACTLRVPRAVVKQVLDESVSFLANEVLFEGGLGASDSLLASRVSALLAAPLVTAQETLGLIYLDTTDPQARFDEGQLELLTGIAGIAAAALDNTRRFERLEGDRRRLQTEIDVRHNMVGASPALRAVLEFIARVAPSNSTVLICGETGTGKELVARAIHRNSPRAAGPFVAINCAALTETLLESELFGHERGAFTGAVALKKGKLEEAEGGSVFLDEVGELAPALQVKLLRVLQEREFQRLGGTRTIKADIRLVAATNRDLEEAVRAGGFRRDLYYRVNVVSITVPPLRERKPDIPLLANYFAQKHSRNVGRWVAGVSREAQRVLLNYDWPGNIRELENAIERAVVLGSTETILPEDLPEHILEVTPVEEAAATCFHEAVREAKRRIVMASLEQAGGNYTEAARLLGLHPSNLHRLIRQLDLRSGLRRQ